MQAKKALDGLKQSPWTWFDLFNQSHEEDAYWQSKGDHTLFIKPSTKEMVTALWCALMTVQSLEMVMWKNNG